MELKAHIVSMGGASSVPGKPLEVRLSVADITAAEIHVIEVRLRNENGFSIHSAGQGALVIFTGDYGPWEPFDKLLEPAPQENDQRKVFFAESFVVDPAPVSADDVLFIEALHRHGVDTIAQRDVLVVEREPSLSEVLTFDRVYCFHRTERHGYLEVTGDELRELEILPQISPFSFHRQLADIYLLEEDCDAPLFLRTIAERLGKSETAVWKNNTKDVEVGHLDLLEDTSRVAQANAIEISVEDGMDIGVIGPEVDDEPFNDWNFRPNRQPNRDDEE